MITEIMIILALIFGGADKLEKPAEPIYELLGNGGGGCPGGICDKEEDD